MSDLSNIVKDPFKISYDTKWLILRYKKPNIRLCKITKVKYDC